MSRVTLFHRTTAGVLPLIEVDGLLPTYSSRKCGVPFV